MQEPIRSHNQVLETVQSSVRDRINAIASLRPFLSRCILIYRNLLLRYIYTIFLFDVCVSTGSDVAELEAVTTEIVNLTNRYLNEYILPQDASYFAREDDQPLNIVDVQRSATWTPGHKMDTWWSALMEIRKSYEQVGKQRSIPIFWFHC